MASRYRFPRSFINTQKALELSNKIDNAEIHPYNEETKYRCFNNNDIAIKGVVHMELKSGSWNAKNCKILVVDNKTNNIMGRDELDIQYSSCPPPVTTTPLEIDLDDSENKPLSLTKPRKISPSELHFSIGDKTTKLIFNKKNVAWKTIMRKTKEPRPTLAPQWNIIPHGTITGYSPHTITIDTSRRKKHSNKTKPYSNSYRNKTTSSTGTKTPLNSHGSM